MSIPSPVVIQQHVMTVNGAAIDVNAELHEARRLQDSPDAKTSLAGLLREASLLNSQGNTAEAISLLVHHYPRDVSLGWQGEYLYTLGRIEYDSDPAQGLAYMNRAIELVGPGYFQMHLLMMRDAKLGLWIPDSPADVPIPE